MLTKSHRNVLFFQNYVFLLASLIGQVIRGGHRTKAIKLYSDKEDKLEENFWLYTVFIPGNIIYLSLIAVFLTWFFLLSHQ